MRSTVLLTFILILTSCDKPPPPPPRRDSGTIDAGGVLDGGGMDSGPDFDAGPDFDGGARDAGPRRDGGMVSCAVSPSDRHLLSTESGERPRIIGLDGSSDSFGIVWNEIRDGRPDLFGVVLSPSGLGAEQRFTDQPSRENPPTIVASGTGWLVAWVDNHESTGFEIRTQTAAANLSPTGTTNRLTNTPALLEDNPTLVNLAAGPMLVWSEDDMILHTRIAKAATLSLSGTASGSVETFSTDAQRPGQVALGELADGPVALWTEGTGLSQDLLLQRMTASGARTGEPIMVSTEGNADGTVDAALGVTGGAVVFGVLVGGVRREVRFRAMDADGVLVGDERSLLPSGITGTDASITRFAGGYAVAFRGTDDTGVKIFLLLVSGDGELLDQIAVSDAAAFGGRVTLRASASGHLGLAWVDTADASTDVVAALVRCGP